MAAYHRRQRPGSVVESLHSSSRRRSLGPYCVSKVILIHSGSRIAGNPGREERVSNVFVNNGSVRIRNTLFLTRSRPRPSGIDATIGRRLGNGDGGITAPSPKEVGWSRRQSSADGTQGEIALTVSSL